VEHSKHQLSVAIVLGDPNMQYRIFPAIGTARIGNSAEVFIGPEVIGSHGRELDGSEVARFKDANYAVRKQAARFHVFQRNDESSPWVPLQGTALVEWSVTLANKKDAIVRPSSPIDPRLANPTLRIRPQLDPARANRQMSAAGVIRSDAGAAATQTLSGTHVGIPVKLGQLCVDAGGRLIISGGDIVSAANPVSSPIGPNFYDNPDWHDDVADGPVSATITVAGQTFQADGAWCIVGPPDFAPGADPIVSLFDKLLQVAIDNSLGGSWIPLPQTPSFTTDIQPIIRRARSLGWVQKDQSVTDHDTNEKNWTRISEDYARLNNKDRSQQQLRRDTQALILNVENLLSDYRVPAWQRTLLGEWVAGAFNDDWTGVPTISANPTAESLTRSALAGAVGQGFFPGIEGGRILADPSIFVQPFDFRIDHNVLSAGDVTALMAQPWQADFLKCYGNWWPSQRPDIAIQSDGTFLDWHRPLDPDSDHARMVQFVPRFGMLTVQFDATGKQVSAREDGRDPTLPVA
jgi:hypothetical protein